MTTTWEDQIKTWAGEWRTRFEEMRVQFALGKMDATTLFEQQKSMLTQTVTHWKQQLDSGLEQADESRKKLQGAIESLLLQLNLGKADGIDAFNEQRKKIETALQEVYAKGRETYEQQYNTLMQVFENQSQLFKTHLEIIQLQYALGKMEARDEADRIRKELEEKIRTLQQQYTTSIQYNAEAWNKQIHEHYEQVKNWISDFLPHTKK